MKTRLETRLAPVQICEVAGQNAVSCRARDLIVENSGEVNPPEHVEELLLLICRCN